MSLCHKPHIRLHVFKYVVWSRALPVDEIAKCWSFLLVLLLQPDKVWRHHNTGHDIYSIKSYSRGEPPKPPLKLLKRILRASYARGTEIGIGLSKTVFGIKILQNPCSRGRPRCYCSQKTILFRVLFLPHSLTALLDRSILSRALSLSERCLNSRAH